MDQSIVSQQYPYSGIIDIMKSNNEFGNATIYT